MSDIDYKKHNDSRDRALIFWLMLVLLFGAALSIPMFYLGDQAHTHAGSTPLYDFSRQQRVIETLDESDSLGKLSEVRYIWSESHYERGFGIHGTRNYYSRRIQASALFLENGKHVVALGQVPDYAHGSAVYAAKTEDGLLSEYCIKAPVNDCFKPSSQAYIGKPMPTDSQRIH